MSIAWSDLRSLNGSKHSGFEELCCQLAMREPHSAKERFVRIGAPDAGVEGYWLNDNGQKRGWQAKYFPISPQATQWSQIDKSVKTALDKHQELIEYTVCLPVNLPDAQIGRAKSALEKWKDYVKKWEKLAKSKKRKVKFFYWGETQLWERLSKPQYAGMTKFWFDKDLMSLDWFADHQSDFIADARPRYTPETNVEVPVVSVLDALCRTPNYFAQLKRMRREVRKTCFDAIRAYPSKPLPKAKRSTELKGQCERLLALVDEVCDADRLIAPWQEIDRVCSEVMDLVGKCREELRIAETKTKADSKSTSSSGSSAIPDYAYGHHILSKLSEACYSLNSMANSQESRASNERSLCLLGEAGKGKTHLLCDVATKQIEAGKPAVVLFGEHFSTASDPWTQILNRLGFSGNANEFLGALESAGLATNCRAIIILDALNEGAGKELWFVSLAGFINKIKKFKQIVVTVSVRSSYTDIIVPEELDDTKLLKVVHEGFSGVEFEASDKYFQAYGILPPSVPLLVPEFSTPLFLKLLCQGMKNEGMTTIPPGFFGLSKVFSFFIASIKKRIIRLMKLDPKAVVIEQAISSLVNSLIERGQSWIPRSDATRLLNDIHPSVNYPDSLLFHLLDEGLLAEDRFYDGAERVDGVRFSYERLSDHLIVNYLLSGIESDGDLKPLFETGGIFAWFLVDELECQEHAGLIEALSIQLPERYSQEIGELIGPAASYHVVRSAFVQSLAWRSIEAIGENTKRYISEHLVQNDLDQLYDAFLTVATNPDHPYNAYYLHELLLKLELPKRDYYWTLYIHNLYGKKRALDRLLRWAWSENISSGLSDESVLLGAIAVSWFLTASHRFLRDRATKALVCLLSQRIHLVEQLLRKFENVDDIYITERLYAIAYGSAMRNRGNKAVSELALYLYQREFDSRNPVLHILARDYARGIVELAYMDNPDLDVCPPLIYPPYFSEMPTIPSENTIKKIDASIEIENKKPRGYGILRFSIMDDDFARYVIGTNHNHSRWSASKFNCPLKFKTIHYKLNSEIDKFWNIEGVPSKSVGSSRQLIHFDLRRIQRYILKRVIDIGWELSLFGQNDEWVDRMGWERQANKIERIGKKYQWIGYHEILAAIADNYEFLGDGFSEEEEFYQGPWQLTYGRDIDPSHTISLSNKDRESHSESRWWTPSEYQEWEYDQPNSKWTKRVDDLPDEKSHIEVSNPSDSVDWFTLKSAIIWRSGDLEELRQSRQEVRELWYEISTLIVQKSDVDRTLRWANKYPLVSKHDSTAGNYRHVFLGEHYWGQAAEDWIDRYEVLDGWEALPEIDTELLALKPVQEYDHESSGYDCSSDVGFACYLPHFWLMRELDLVWNKADATYVDRNGEVAIFDPALGSSSGNCLLIRKDILERFLQESEYGLIWILRGKKIVYGDDSNRPDQLEISGAYTLKDGVLKGKRSYHLWLKDGLYKLNSNGGIGQRIRDY